MSAWLNCLSDNCTVVFVPSTAVKGSSLHAAVSLSLALTQAALGASIDECRKNVGYGSDDGAFIHNNK